MSSFNTTYAHIDAPSNRKEFLFHADASHAQLTATLAARFAEAMAPPHDTERVAFLRAMGRLLGPWHDLGKCSREFQRYLQSAGEDAHTLERRGRVDHSSAGAQHAVAQLSHLGCLLAFAIAGHHAGLPDWHSTGESGLKSRLRKTIPPWREWAPPDLLAATGLPSYPPCPRNGFACAFLTRMLFSCLVDADFMATESFMDPERATRRVHHWPTMAELARHLDAHLATTFPAANTAVQQQRQEVLRQCQLAAPCKPGFFSLNVPTGGGKTLSSLVFALHHAAGHDLRRVICAIPYTSIIEQNAQVYRDIFAVLGEEIVLEHHANLDPNDPTVMASRLAAENWDAPIVVTTNVQLFETLFANRPGRCRKLHRIARSVIVLDEAQALPVHGLKPCLRALQELVERYGCSVVLCTATQPALEWRENFNIGLKEVREIIPNPAALHQALRRVQVSMVGQLTLEESTAQLAREERVLAIVNSRRHARELYDRLHAMAGPADLFHLSTRMCPQHRSTQLTRIRKQLHDPLARCRVVATQLVEAGVDFDFPVVYRALTGLDAIAQAAGRCNREGRLPGLGSVRVFHPAEKNFLPPGELGLAAQHAGEILPSHPDDILSLHAIEHYFQLHYWHRGGELGTGWDVQDVLGCFAIGDNKEPFQFNFREAASKFRIIQEDQESLIIPWDEQAQAMIATLRALSHPEPALLAKASRLLQRYAVPVYPWENRILQKSLAVEQLHERFAILLDRECYHDATGLIIPEKEYCDPEKLII